MITRNRHFYKMPSEKIEEITVLYSRGLSMLKVAEISDIGFGTVQKWIKIVGISRKRYKTGKYHHWFGKRLFGEKNYNWKGGIFTLNLKIRKINEYKDWVKSVLSRDKYKCRLCGKTGSGIFEIHHSIPVKTIIKEYNLITIEDVLNCAILWDINNGITLCKDCHKKVHK